MLEVANEIIDKDESLTVAEREDLKQDLEDIALETPRAQPANARGRQLLAKLGERTIVELKAWSAEVASSALAKLMRGY